MNQKEWMTVPVLFCASLDETLDFWEALGYKKTYYQKSPYGYGVMSRGEYGLHFVQQKGIKPEENPIGCLVMITDVELVHRNFSKALKGKLGRVPNKGLPRITRIRPGQTRFTVTDPSGNWVTFIKFGEEDEEIVRDSEQKGEQTPLEFAISRAVRFREFKLDIAGAAKILDVALERHGGESPLLIARALLLRADIAIDLEETASARANFEKMRELSLSTQDRASLSSEIERLNEMLA
ncbi:MAG: hypothetical protein KF726_21855 [Anaerolineae bacterium]|nr:hypothetical protein [Anaerolineae bacterium]